MPLHVDHDPPLLVERYIVEDPSGQCKIVFPFADSATLPLYPLMLIVCVQDVP